MKLQDEMLAKEEVRISAMRQRALERTARFMNAKNRTIGVDKESLDRQVQEKNRERQSEEVKAIQEAKRQEQMRRHLEEADFVAKEEKKKEVEELTRDLMNQMKMSKNNAPGKGDPIDVDSCGPASVQRLVGEDLENRMRKKMQQEQVKQWYAQQISELEQQNMKQTKENQNHHEDLVAARVRFDELRREANGQQQNNLMAIHRDNRTLAERVNTRRDNDEKIEQRLGEFEVMNANSDPFLVEDTDAAFFGKDSTSLKIRPDHFKGWSKSHVKHITTENDALLSEKEAKHAREEEEERQWTLYQNRLLQEMEEREIRKRQMVAHDNSFQAEVLRAQRIDLKEKQRHMKNDRFGAIGKGFFDKFGTSSR